MNSDPSVSLSLLEALPASVIVMDQAGNPRFINAHARNVLQGMVGSAPCRWIEDAFEVYDFLGARLSINEMPGMRAAQFGEEERDVLVHVRLTGNQGKELFLKINSSPIFDLSGNLEGSISVIEDVTDQYQVIGRSRDHSARDRLVATLSKIFAETGNDYPAVLKVIVKTIAGAMGDACLIRMVTEDKSYLHLSAYWHIQPEVLEVVSPVLEESVVLVEKSVQGRVFRDRKALVLNGIQPGAVPDVAEMFQPVMVSCAPRSMIIAPLITPANILGTISVWRSPNIDQFCDDDLDFFQELANRAAMAIENARLYAEEVQRNRELNALRDATIALMSTLDLEVLLGRILDAAQHAIPASERGLLFLAAPRTGRLELRAVLGFGDPRIRRANFLKDGRIERAISEHKPFLINDIFQTGYPNELLQEETAFFRSAIFAPLVLGTEVLGVLTLSSSRSYAFSQSDLRLLVSFAATTTAAINNAMLHTEVQKIAITDPLTGLYNRRGLEELGGHEFDRYRRFGHPFSVTMLDIDHFKQVNDRYGHTVGDLVLKGLAEKCRSVIRQVDILGRYGGEEFVILLPETDLFQAVNLSERLRRLVADTPIPAGELNIPITISLGVTRASRNHTSLSMILDQADKALYDAKSKGRNRVEIG